MQMKSADGFTLQGDMSVTQEDLKSSRKTNNGGVMSDKELKKVLQPDFIKSIDLVKNGQSVQEASPTLRGNKSRKSRLERRLECQNQRVVTRTQVASNFANVLWQ